MSHKTFTERKKSNRSVIGAVAFGTLGAAVVLVPKVRKAVVGAAGMALDAIQERYQESAARRRAERPASSTEPRTRPKAEAAAKPRGAQRKSGRKSNVTKSTAPGFVNENEQETLRRAGKSESWKGQYIYELRCLACGHHYGANGPEIKSRQCPECQDGSEGEPI